jgi:Fe-S-cluster containining protein
MARGLSFQSTYSCGRTGACCTADWPIPVEADRLARWQAAAATGQLAGRSWPAADTWVADDPRLPRGGPPLLAHPGHRCVFLASDGGHSCRIHAALGHEALPLACRQFPRVSVVDPRGVSVVLSAYCPTAAALLSTDGPVSILETSAAFPAAGEYIGLDARHGWPPILRPGVLMDWPSWWEFERRAVDLLGNSARSPDEGLARLTLAVERTRAWRVEDGPLEAAVTAAFDDALDAPHATRVFTDAELAARVTAVETAIPYAFRPVHAPVRAPRETPARVLRYLATHAFANWAIHLGEDLRVWLASLETAYALVTFGLSAREADLRLRHLLPGLPAGDLRPVRRRGRAGSGAAP